jgi:hypothetical protein
VLVGITRSRRQLKLTVGGAAVRNTVWADSMGNGGAVIPKERRHVLLRQPQTANLIAVTPGTASDQGVGQHPRVIIRPLSKAQLVLRLSRPRHKCLARCSRPRRLEGSAVEAEAM